MPQSPGAIRATVLVLLAALSTLAVGLLILVGGSMRFSSPAFTTARDLAPSWVWGVAMVVSGGMAVTGGWIHVMVLSRLGHSLSALVYVFWVITLADAVIPNHNQALTGLGIYSGFAALHAWAAATADLEQTTRKANEASRESRQRYDDVTKDD